MRHPYFIILLSFCLPPNVYSQAGKLSGEVVNDKQVAAAGALVKFLDRPGEQVTDSTGRFVFVGLIHGHYRVEVSYPGYNRQTVHLDIHQDSLFVTISLSKVDNLPHVTVRTSNVASRKEQESLNLEIIKSEFIQRNLGGSLMKTLERLPGIKTIGIGSGQSKPLIRGLGFNRVVVVEKGIKHEGQQWGADHGLEIDQFAAAEVALIKGAASFVYGSDAIAGVIDIKPANVPGVNTIGGSADLIGKSNNNSLGTSVNFFKRRDRWFFDARFTYQNYADYRVPADTVYVYSYAVPLHQHYLRNTAGRETGLHLNTGYIGNHFRSIFYLSNTHSNSGFFANAHGLEPRRVNTALHDGSARDIMMPSQEVNHFKVINRSTYTFQHHKLEMDLGYQRNYRQEFSHYVNHGYMPPVYPSEMSAPQNLEREFNKHVFAVNLRDIVTSGKHTITSGITSEYQHNNIGGWSFLVPAFKQATAGAFIYDHYKLNEQTSLHAAIRYDYGKLHMHEYTDWFASDVTSGNNTLSQKLTRAENLVRRFNSLVWSAGINYNPEDFNFRINIGKSFRMPIAKELSANGVNYHYFSYERGNANLSPEQSYQADVGLGWNTEKWFVQFSPFYNYFPNYIYLNPTSAHDYYYGAGNQVFKYAQSRVMRYGGEVQARYHVLKTVSVELLGEYLYARQLSGDKRGYTLPFSPPPSGLANITWSPAINNTFSKTYFSLDFRRTLKQDNIVPPEKKTPGYSIIHLQTGSEIKIAKQVVQLSLQVQNLLNTRYLNHTSFYRLIELPEAGRNVVLSLKIPFRIQSAVNLNQP
ncbi:TonB-dependent receptor [Segetibacter sp. 3557_3]|uniref:TonB-dependent receptor n=1 Tax=Segetibacter sp. 3557_3 TaxID=2547429 RepID=UPI001058B6D8|nr:TonB-dependent receptor [Segetibacter sp. 3557_3]TDH26964.1 TonB-dependent receptor [Segetibacter sp. 3557_3]